MNGNMTQEIGTSKKMKVQFLQPPNRLRVKVGTGGLPENIIQRAQKILDSTDLDFGPMADDYIEMFDEALQKLSDTPDPTRNDILQVTLPVMQLKANGGMFRYQLITDVANILLNFLEELEPAGLNEDAWEIINAHAQAIRSVVAHRVEGDGGGEGRQLKSELYDACRRYFEKYNPEKIGEIPN